MRKVYIDCGSYKGGTIRSFIKNREYDKDFIIYSFEALEAYAGKQEKVLKNVISMENINLIKKVVWIYDGEIDFYASGRRAGRAGSILKNKKSRRNRATVLPCLDFSKWIIDNFNKDDYIILKMDIEGAEFEVLNKMIKDKSIEYINRLYLEKHTKRYDGEIDFKYIKKSIQNVEGLEYCTAIEVYYKKHFKKIKNEI